MKIAAVTLGIPTVATAQIGDEELLGRAEPPFVKAKVSISRYNLAMARWDVIARSLELLAEQSKMNRRLLQLSVSQKWCQVTNQPRPSPLALLKAYPDKSGMNNRDAFIEIGVETDGKITFKAIPATPKKKK